MGLSNSKKVVMLVIVCFLMNLYCFSKESFMTHRLHIFEEESKQNLAWTILRVFYAKMGGGGMKPLIHSRAS